MPKLQSLCGAMLGLVLAWVASSAESASVGPPNADVASLLGESTAFWQRQFAASQAKYVAPDLTYFTGALANPCKLSFAVVGPFYCPADQHLYIDRGFVADAVRRAGGSRDAVLAYLVAHEVAHHIQALAGTTAAVEQAQSRSSPEVARRTLDALELQADCFAGVWLGSSGRRSAFADADSLRKALAIVAATSDAQAQKAAPGQMTADLLTHGTPAQREHWLGKGVSTGNLAECDTFSAQSAGLSRPRMQVGEQAVERG